MPIIAAPAGSYGSGGGDTAFGAQ